MELKEICSLVNDKVDTSSFNIEDYVSTENLLPEKGGLSIASNLPSGKATLFQTGDILISNIRPYFKKIWLAQKKGCCNNDVLCIRPNNKTTPSFLFYLLSQNCFFDYVMKGSKGTKMPRGDKQHIMKWTICVPSLDEQRSIASILSSLDSKIENNRKICANLEAQAQALFKHWFIDFAPFKDGKFVESELGMIPEGWEINTIDDFCRVFTGKKNTNQAEDNGKYPFFSCAPNPLNSNDYLYDGYAIIIAGNGSYTGRTQLYNGKFDLYQRTYACVAKERNFDKKIVFFYLLMKQTFEREKMGGTRGSSIPYIVMNDIAKQYFCYNDYVVTEFCSIVRPILDMKQALHLESSRLSTLRDTLLPKLMSGAIKV